MGEVNDCCVRLWTDFRAPHPPACPVVAVRSHAVRTVSTGRRPSADGCDCPGPRHRQTVSLVSWPNLCVLSAAAAARPHEYVLCAPPRRDDTNTNTGHIAGVATDSDVVQRCLMQALWLLPPTRPPWLRKATEDERYVDRLSYLEAFCSGSMEFHSCSLSVSQSRSPTIRLSSWYSSLLGEINSPVP